MNRMLKYLEQVKFQGDAMEFGGTSIQGPVAPPLKWIYEKKYFNEEDKILDYGAGKYARNADFLRNKGFQVYAYDPYNHNGPNGWDDGCVSDVNPKNKFDVIFTSYVLNVLPENIEDDILKETNKKGKTIFHITRNTDIYDTVQAALNRNGKNDTIIVDWFINEFKGNINNLSKNVIMEFCYFGVQTSKGFQRIPKLEDKGFQLLKSANGYKIYMK